MILEPQFIRDGEIILEYSHSFKLTVKLAGFALEPSKDWKVKVGQKGYLTDYDGELFFTVLQESSKIFLSDWSVNHKLPTSIISNYLIIIDSDNNCNVKINFPLTIDVCLNRGCKPGEPIYKSDIIDIRGLRLGNPDEPITIPDNCAVIFFFTHNWLRGLYYDFLPLVGKKSGFSDYGSLFGYLFSILSHPELFKDYSLYSEQIMARGWFPFIHIIGKDVFKNLIESIKQEIYIDEAELEVIKVCDQSIEEMIPKWIKKEPFLNKLDFFRSGIDSYVNGDYIASIHTLLPQIEGVIHLYDEKNPFSGSIPKCREKLLELANEKGAGFLFLKEEFDNYLKTQYYENFDLTQGSPELTRHSTSHGVVSSSEFSKKRALQIILTIDQIYYYL